MLFQTTPLFFILSVSTSSSSPRWTYPNPDENKRKLRPFLQPTERLFASEVARPKTGTSPSARKSRNVSPAVPWQTTVCFPEGGASKPSHDTSHSTGSQISITTDDARPLQSVRGFEERLLISCLLSLLRGYEKPVSVNIIDSRTLKHCLQPVLLL